MCDRKTTDNTSGTKRCQKKKAVNRSDENDVQDPIHFVVEYTLPFELLVMGWIRLFIIESNAIENVPIEIKIICKRFHGNFQWKYEKEVDGCYSDQSDKQFECTQRIRKITSIGDDSPIQEIILSGLVPRLIQFLSYDDNPELQLEAAWALTNIAAGKKDETAVVVKHGVIPQFIKLLHSTNIKVKEQAIWGLGNIAGDSAELRNLVLSQGAMVALLKICNVKDMQTQNEIELQRNLAWSLSNFCRGKPQLEWQYIGIAIKALRIMSMTDDEEILAEVCWAFSYLSDIDDDTLIPNDESPIRAMYESGGLAHLVGLLEHENPHIRHPALRSIGNVVTADDEEPTQWLLDLGVLKKLQSLLAGDRPPIMREACWTISNITAGSQAQIEAVVHANLIPMLINILKNDKYEIAKEALWALSNAASGGSDAQITFLVNQGIIGSLCRFLKLSQRNKDTLTILEALEKILMVGCSENGGNEFAGYVMEADGDYILEDIQTNQSLPNQIQDLARHLLCEVFKL